MNNDDFLFSSAIVSLLKGVVYATGKDKIWETVKEKQTSIEDYVSKMGLTLVVHNEDGYAYLQQRVYDNDEKAIPKIVAKRQMNFITSLALVLLRKEMIELNKIGNGERFIMSKQLFIDKMLPFFKNATDEVKQKREIEITLNKLAEMGFVRFLDNKDDDFEILLIVRGFVNAQLLEDVDTKLKEYMEYNSIEINDNVLDKREVSE